MFIDGANTKIDYFIASVELDRIEYVSEILATGKCSVSAIDTSVVLARNLGHTKLAWFLWDAFGELCERYRVLEKKRRNKRTTSMGPM